MRVSDDSSTEDTIENGVDGSDGSRSDQGNESDRQESFERPVVTTVGLVRGRERCRVVDGTFNICCDDRARRENKLEGGSGLRGKSRQESRGLVVRDETRAGTYKLW